MSFFNITLNSDVGRKIRGDGLQFHSYTEALAHARDYSNMKSVARAVVTLIHETHQATFRKGVRS